MKPVQDKDELMDGRVKRIFYPPNKPKTMKEAYPELATIEEFEELTDEEMRFSYFLGCKDSPNYEDYPQRLKVSKCFDKAFGKSAYFEPRKQRYIGDNYEEKILKAIIRWKMFEPSVRERASKMITLMLNEYESIIDKFEGTNWETPEQAKAYVDMSMKVTAALPEIVRQHEHNYGVSDVKKIKTKEGDTVDEFEDVMDSLIE